MGRQLRTIASTAFLSVALSLGLSAQPLGGRGVCVLSGGQTTNYVLTATNGGNGCSWQAAPGTGTVTSVGLVGTANQLTVTGSSPITGSGSWTLSLPAGLIFPGYVTFAASTTSHPSFNIPSGSFPTSPTSGDFGNISGILKFYDGTNTQLITQSTAALTSNAVVLGGGNSQVSALGSLGTTTTVLHGNASGAPSFANVVSGDFGSGTLAVANGGTNIASGTSGGILGFTGSTTIASSVALTANMPVIGGGAGATPTVGTVSGNTTEFVTTTGTQTSTDVVKIDANGNHIASGCTIDSSNNLSCPGSVTAGSGSSNTGYWSLQGKTSGAQGMTVADVAGTSTLYVIPTAVSSGSFLKDNGSTTCPSLAAGAPSNCEALAWASPSGSGTVNSGTIHQLGVYAATGTAISGDANVTESSGAVTIGVNSSVQGSLTLGGSAGTGVTIAGPSSGGGTMTLQAGSDAIVGRATTDTLTNKTINCANNTCTVRAADIATANPIITLTNGSSRTISNALGEIIICTTTCTVTPPATGSTVAGMQFCAQNDDNVSTVITIAAVASVLYENTARTSYKAANTAIASAGAVKDQICFVARDATHWNVFSATGTWN